MAKSTSNALVVEKVIALQLSEIDIDWRWNSRKGIRDESGRLASAATTAQGEEQTTEFGTIKASIASEGQIDAVIVRTHPDERKRTKTPYMLVAGFQRCESLRQLAEEGVIPGGYDGTWVKQPTVKAIIRQMTEKEAALENLRENTSRSELSGSDLAFGVQRYMRLDPDASETEIAKKLGKSQGYINMICKIIKGLEEHSNSKLLHEWRDAPKVLTIAQMTAVANKKTPDDQTAEFNKILRGERKTGGRDKWVERVAAEAKLRGHALGMLENQGVITIAQPKTLCSEGVVRQMVTFKAHADKTAKSEMQAEQDAKFAGFVRQIIAAFSDGYNIGRKGKVLPSKDQASAEDVN